MKIKKYKAKFKIEKIYEVEVETPGDPSTDAENDTLSDMVLQDYENGKYDNDLELDCQFSLYDYEEIK